MIIGYARTARDGKPRFVIGYLRGWRSERKPAGDFCWRVEPNGNFYRIEYRRNSQ
jgi:hypothetical protein